VTATNTSSTARDVHHERGATQRGPSSLRRPTRRAARRGCRRSSCRWTHPASRSKSISTSSASARRTHLLSRCRTVRVPVENQPRRRGRTASRSRWRHSTSRRPGTAIGAVGVAQAAYEHASSMRRRASPSTCRSRCTRRSTFMIADMADGDRGVAPALLAGSLDARPGLRPQDDALLLVREALRRRHGDEGRDRRLCRSSAATGTSRSTPSRS